MGQIEISLDVIEGTTHKALTRHGAADWVAKEVAKAVKKAEATGNKICGLYYLESYCKQLVTGRVKGDVEPEVSQPKPASVKVDAKFGFAQPAFARGLSKAIEVAENMGTASLGVGHAHTCTSLGYFTEQIAERGLIGIGFTNASAIVAPPGGKTPILGTNPLAMAIPAKEGGVHFQFDQSTTTVALGKITMAASAGESIPLGWAKDENGDPTTDPHAALKGSLESSGGYKGFGLGLMVEVLASTLLGSKSSTDVGKLKAPEGQPHGLGQFYLLIDPTTYTDDFYEKLNALQAMVERDEAARLPGSKRIVNPCPLIDEDFWNLTLELAGEG